MTPDVERWVEQKLSFQDVSEPDAEGPDNVCRRKHGVDHRGVTRKKENRPGWHRLGTGDDERKPEEQAKRRQVPAGPETLQGERGFDRKPFAGHTNKTHGY